MPNGTDTAEIGLLISHSAAWDGWSKALNLFIGRGKRFSGEQASKATGICKTMIYGWRCGEAHDDWRRPHMGHVLSMMAFLGPEFSSELMRDAQQGAHWLPDADDTAPGTLAAEVSEGAASIVRAAADGKFDKDERRALAPVGRHLMVVGAQLERAGRAA
jgi:hypothetical protein